MKNNFIILTQLVKRAMKIFLKDKAAVFFSLLAPLIVLVLYGLFLGDLQVNALEEALAGLEISAGLIRSFIAGWMLAGTIAVACITVSFSAHNVMITDREEGRIADMLVSPIKPGLLNLSYLVYNYIVTLFICTLVLIVAFIYLAVIGWYLTALDVLGILGAMLVAILMSSLLSTLICMLFKTGSAHGAFIGILSAAIGFLCGAYMPISMFPKGVQYVILFNPGTYSAGIFRNLFMTGALNEISAVSPDAAQALKTDFSMNLNFFGAEAGPWAMLGVIAGFIFLLAAINIIIGRVKKRKTAVA